MTQSTVQSIVGQWKKLKADKCDPSSIAVLPWKPRGRPTLMGKELDERVMDYLFATRETGGVINSRVVISTAKGLASVFNPSLLQMNGGFLGRDSKPFAKFLLARMNYTKRKGTKTAKKVPDNLEDIHKRFSKEIENKMKEASVPPDFYPICVLIVNSALTSTLELQTVVHILRCVNTIMPSNFAIINFHSHSLVA